MAACVGTGFANNGLSSFTHHPLGQSNSSIGILHILSKRSGFDLVQCELVHTTFDVAYTCLSYVWGSPETERLILVNGKLLEVRENLYRFLSAATRAKGQFMSTWYWIDSLSIDQSDITERNHQVAQMGSIYSQTQGVTIWMGTGISRTRLLNIALEAWALMGQSATFAEFQAAGNDTNICNHEVAKTGQLSPRRPAGLGLGSRKKYFSRARYAFRQTQ